MRSAKLTNLFEASLEHKKMHSPSGITARIIHPASGLPLVMITVKQLRMITQQRASCLGLMTFWNCELKWWFRNSLNSRDRVSWGSGVGWRAGEQWEGNKEILHSNATYAILSATVVVCDQSVPLYALSLVLICRLVKKASSHRYSFIFLISHDFYFMQFLCYEAVMLWWLWCMHPNACCEYRA